MTVLTALGEYAAFPCLLLLVYGAFLSCRYGRCFHVARTSSKETRRRFLQEPDFIALP